jgi:hypothetical protein
MSSRALDLIPDYVLGTLSAEETREVEEALASSEDLRREADALREAFGGLALALPSRRPSSDVKMRLLKSIAAEPYAPFAAGLSRYFDLAVDKVRDLLKWAADPSTSWTDGPLPGIRLLDFPGGPRVATCDVGFVRLPAGLHFPWHRHPGYEVNFIIEGSIRDFDGTIYGPGQAIEKAAGTEHEFFVGTDRDVVLGVVVEKGFEIIPKPE